MASLKAGVVVISTGTCPGVFVLPSKSECDEITQEILGLPIESCVYEFKVLNNGKYQHILLRICESTTYEHKYAFNLSLMRLTQACINMKNPPERLMTRWRKLNALSTKEKLSAVFSEYPDLYETNESSMNFKCSLPIFYGVYERGDEIEWNSYDLQRYPSIIPRSPPDSLKEDVKKCLSSLHHPIDHPKVMMDGGVCIVRTKSLKTPKWIALPTWAQQKRVMYAMDLQGGSPEIRVDKRGQVFLEIKTTDTQVSLNLLTLTSTTTQRFPKSLIDELRLLNDYLDKPNARSEALRLLFPWNQHRTSQINPPANLNEYNLYHNGKSASYHAIENASL